LRIVRDERKITDEFGKVLVLFPEKFTLLTIRRHQLKSAHILLTLTVLNAVGSLITSK
jgi:hypothetical protein